MAILTKDDLDNINTLFTKNFESIWEDNIAPAMATKDELKEMEVRLKKDIHDARDHIDNKIAEYSGKAVARDHGLEKRIDLTDHKLMEKNIFTDQDLQDIKAVPVFDPTNA